MNTWTLLRVGISRLVVQVPAEDGRIVLQSDMYILSAGMSWQ